MKIVLDLHTNEPYNKGQGLGRRLIWWLSKTKPVIIEQHTFSWLESSGAKISLKGSSEKRKI